MTRTQKLILESASKLFRTGGFTNTGLRQIAADAGVEASLIIRHFGSKEELFMRALNYDQQNELTEVPTKVLGTSMVEYMFNNSDDPQSALYTFGTLLRASDNERVYQQLRQNVEDTMVSNIREYLTGEDIELRARLMTAIMVGLMTQMYVICDEMLLNEPREKIIQRYGAALQQIIDN